MNAHRSAVGAQQKAAAIIQLQRLRFLAEWTGLEPATPGVTGRYSNQLNYHSSAASALASQVLPACCLVNDDQPVMADRSEFGDPTGIRTPVLTVKG